MTTFDALVKRNRDFAAEQSAAGLLMPALPRALPNVKALIIGCADMRKRRAGHIINITSMGGYITMPGIGYYCGSKFALEAISETLSKEVRDFGIRVSAIAPGQFRTDWAGRSMTRTERTISDYDKLMDPVRQARQNKSGKQPGDPAKAAQVLLQIIEAPNSPTHLLLGDDALKFVREKLQSLNAEFAAWENVTRSTGYKDAAPLEPGFIK
jgi:short-subunit dehydrogenase